MEWEKTPESLVKSFEEKTVPIECERIFDALLGQSLEYAGTLPAKRRPKKATR